MKKTILLFSFISFSSLAFAVCPALKAEKSAKLAGVTFAEMRGMSGGLNAKASKKSFASTQGEVAYRVDVSPGILAGETYDVLVDKNCLPSAIQLSDGLE